MSINPRPVVPEGSTIVQTNSHRARDTLERYVVGHKLRGVYEWMSSPGLKTRHYVVIPVEFLESALKVKSVKRAHPKGELSRCW